MIECQWFTPVIQSPQEAKIRRITVQGPGLEKIPNIK
jgi:hypothetical protein